MIFETSNQISSNQALFGERSKNGGGGDSGGIAGILIVVLDMKNSP